MGSSFGAVFTEEISKSGFLSTHFRFHAQFHIEMFLADEGLILAAASPIAY